MNGFVASTNGKVHIIHLSRGDDILESLEQYISENHIVDGVLASGIGTVDQCKLHFVTDASDAGAMLFREWKDTPLEVAGMQGIIAGGKPHIHVTVSNEKESWAGHLEPGCRTLFLCEIAILELEGEHLTRVPETDDLSNPDHFIMNLIGR